MSSFLQQKKQREQNSASLVDRLNAANSKSEMNRDDRFYYPERDAQGNGYAIIRFLPEAKDNETEIVKTMSHGFKSASGKWFIENCPTTLGHDCPVCNSNSEIWNRSKEEYEKIGRDRKRKTSFVSNIVVIADPKHPENVGKNFLFQFGTKIFDMISAKASPQFPTDKPVNVFSWDHGANFVLRIVKKDKQTNYDQSSFENVSAVADGDESVQEKIFNGMYDLRTFVAPEKFKSYEELEKKFNAVLGASAGRKTTAEDIGSDSPGEEKKSEGKKFHSEPKPEIKEEKQPEEKSSDSSKEMDPIEYFRNLGKKKS